MLVFDFLTFFSAQYTSEQLVEYRRRSDFVFERVHATLQALLSLVPTASKPLFDSLRSRFPYCGCDIEFHAVYTANLLKTSVYAPVLRDRILSLLVDRMVDIDVQIFIDDEDARGAELARLAALRKQQQQQKHPQQGRGTSAFTDEEDGMLFEMETETEASPALCVVGTTLNTSSASASEMLTLRTFCCAY